MNQNVVEWSQEAMARLRLHAVDGAAHAELLAAGAHESAADALYPQGMVALRSGFLRLLEHRPTLEFFMGAKFHNLYAPLLAGSLPNSTRRKVNGEQGLLLRLPLLPEGAGALATVEPFAEADETPEERLHFVINEVCYLLTFIDELRNYPFSGDVWPQHVPEKFKLRYQQVQAATEQLLSTLAKNPLSCARAGAGARASGDA